MHIHKAVFKQMLTLATSGFGLVSALAWNQFIQEAIDTYIKPFVPYSSTIISKLLYAFFITTLAVIITYQLAKLIEKVEGNKKENAKRKKR